MIKIKWPIFPAFMKLCIKTHNLQKSCRPKVFSKVAKASV